MSSTKPSIHIYQLLAVLILFVVLLFACNNEKKDSSDGKSNMNTMKMEDHTKHQNNTDMPGMEMDDSIEGMNTMSNSNSESVDNFKISSWVMPANYRVISSQKSVKPSENVGKRGIAAHGYISFDERRNNKISTRVSGRIEKLYVKYNLQYLKKGDLIMEIYSPELNTYQEELLFLLKSNSDSVLIAKSEEKLRLLGVTSSQIEKIKRTGSTLLTMNVYSPENGYVFFKGFGQPRINSANSSANKTTGMGNMRNTNTSSDNIISEGEQVREGDYVNKGDVLFWINDLEMVWAIIAVNNRHQQEIKPGTELFLVSELFKNDTIYSQINFIEPIYQPDQKFVMTRCYLKNPGKKYKINSLLEATINAGSTTAVSIPYSSILFLGKRKIVWVLKERTTEGNKIYEARDITIGSINDGMVEIKTGLNTDEEVALNAGYLLDRESLIKPE